MIKWYCHKDTGLVSATLASSAGIARVTGKFGTWIEREVIFHDGSKPVELDPAASGVFIGKQVDENGVPTGDMKIWDTSWEAPSEQGAGYIFRIPLFGSELEGVAEDPTTKTRSLIGEITFVNPSTPVKSQDIGITVGPPVYSDEDFPADPENPMPLPDQIVTVGTVFSKTRFTANGIEVQDTVTGVWRILAIEDGEIQFIELP